MAGLAIFFEDGAYPARVGQRSCIIGIQCSDVLDQQFDLAYRKFITPCNHWRPSATVANYIEQRLVVVPVLEFLCVERGSYISFSYGSMATGACNGEQLHASQAGKASCWSWGLNIGVWCWCFGGWVGFPVSYECN